MKKAFSVFATIIFAVALMVSCSNQTKEETVDVSFTIPTTRDITSTTDALVSTEDNPIVWHYSAQPVNENTKFAHGATLDGTTDANGDEFKVDENYKSSTISLSQGLWNFVLWAVQGSTTVYKGSVDNVLITRQETPVSIVIEISSVIDGVDGTISFADDIVIETSDDATVTEKINRITIEGTDYAYPTETSGKKFTLSAGTHTIYLSYVETFNVGGENKEVFYSKMSYDVTVESGRNIVISGSIKEETASAEFNGTVDNTSSTAGGDSTGNTSGESTYDPSTDDYDPADYTYVKATGNVYDRDADTYYTLDSSSLTFDSAPAVGHKLVLLDCSLSDSIPDSMINDHFTKTGFSANVLDHYNTTGYEWKVKHGDSCTHTDYATLNTSLSSSGYSNSAFKAGYGTKLEPYCIDSLDYFYGVYLNRKDSSSNYTYAYYKWTGDSEIDFSEYYYYSYLCGSLDFNGATITNPNYYVFYNLFTVDNKRSEIKNLKLNYDGIGYPLFYQVHAPTTFKNIEVSGTLFYPLSIGSFAYCLSSSSGNSASSVTFENCASTAELIALPSTSSTDTSAYNLGGFISYTGVTTTININNSSYTGAMYRTTNSSASNVSSVTYNYVIATPSSTSVTVTAYEDNVDKVNGNWQIDISKQKTYAYEDISTLDTTDGVSVVAATGATKADFYYYVNVNVSGSLKTTSGVSLPNYLATLIRVKGVAKIGSNFTTDKVKDMSIEVDGGSTYQLTYDIDNFKLKVGGTLGTVWRHIYVIQRNSDNEIVKISRKYVKETNS